MNEWLDLIYNNDGRMKAETSCIFFSLSGPDFFVLAIVFLSVFGFWIDSSNITIPESIDHILHS